MQIEVTCCVVCKGVKIRHPVKNRQLCHSPETQKATGPKQKRWNVTASLWQSLKESCCWSFSELSDIRHLCFFQMKCCRFHCDRLSLKLCHGHKLTLLEQWDLLSASLSLHFLTLEKKHDSPERGEPGAACSQRCSMIHGTSWDCGSHWRGNRTAALTGCSSKLNHLRNSPTCNSYCISDRACWQRTDIFRQRK